MGYILDLDTVVYISQDLRRRKKKIIYTHGSFDLFHSGHSYLFNKAKKLGDVLIVGVDSDEKVRKFKGERRPVNQHSLRAEMVNNHKDVDIVFSIEGLAENEEDYYVGLYKKLSPHIVVVGNSFGFRNNFRKKLANTEFVLIDLLPEHQISTTDIIQKVLDTHVEKSE
ncbi:adenylyltransferase/cytidyltransferase family protein [Candidatus Nomurabacteria bacterium]|uniref:Adenylyltransferase/cytidyltransferase family protein n=1 Tax=candidate division WWE3 bacterium TaxID=2053526 RepID=A0A955IVS5_UNCKA|nr:adenylyltransferase/cytidyltransferase family protein [candidate division WWE3 bacterium]MCB9823795.1 adenylyltransferase/cytidyltransferase family protein [Candidatus Nomurabacteria bacterium]MCB9826799.1 adenylyltransferase/cytidyltransferase family protein [Candidatus Nomurabacteria bacterium]MCB9827590.1 adenylyltransferase/cytidyltransferase family protein [Candidatus Nomurabacteria bacterium]HXK52965.1 adenylyltransferase/cytidyltransferase family protein [bacterium]